MCSGAGHSGCRVSGTGDDVAKLVAPPPRDEHRRAGIARQTKSAALHLRSTRRSSRRGTRVRVPCGPPRRRRLPGNPREPGRFATARISVSADRWTGGREVARSSKKVSREKLSTKLIEIVDIALDRGRMGRNNVAVTSVRPESRRARRPLWRGILPALREKG